MNIFRNRKLPNLKSQKSAVIDWFLQICIGRWLVGSLERANPSFPKLPFQTGLFFTKEGALEPVYERAIPSETRYEVSIKSVSKD